MRLLIVRPVLGIFVAIAAGLLASPPLVAEGPTDPAALHGGPLWKPLCYAQIGGLLLATLVTKLQAPVMYAIFVLDWKILKWESKGEGPMPVISEGAAD